ncbi:MAG: thiosulfate oxidation carrier protein SoxY [Gammaproteobacteria bacterium]|nr:thiosulfate oxidation carrier protein SoxY [Gammaproteobacteria bacterium]
MSKALKERRQFIKAGMTVPLLAGMQLHLPAVYARSDDQLLVPDRIHAELYRLYGSRADYIFHSDLINLKVPDIAENGAVVPVTLNGQKGMVISAAIFVEHNPKVMAAGCRIHRGADLAVGTRLKLARTSHVYAIADTGHELLGVKCLVRVTIGCGGG